MGSSIFPCDTVNIVITLYMCQKVRHLSRMGQRAPSINLTHIIHIFGAQTNLLSSVNGMKT